MCIRDRVIDQIRIGGTEHIVFRKRFMHADFQDLRVLSVLADVYKRQFYGVSTGLPIEDTLRLASRASSITVSKKGAAASIPTLDIVLAQKK